MLKELLVEEVITTLDELTTQLEDLRSGRRVTELEEEIFLSFERVRRAEIIGRKVVEIMRLQKELDKCRRAKSTLVNRHRDLEHNLISSIQSITQPLIENLRNALTFQMNGLIQREFARISKADGKVLVANNLKAAAEAHNLLRKAYADLEGMTEHRGEDFIELVEKLERDLDALKIDEGESQEMTKEEADALIDRIEQAKHPLPQEIKRTVIDLTKGQQVLDHMRFINKG